MTKEGPAVVVLAGGRWLLLVMLLLSVDHVDRLLLLHDHHLLHEQTGCETMSPDTEQSLIVRDLFKGVLPVLCVAHVELQAAAAAA